MLEPLRRSYYLVLRLHACGPSFLCQGASENARQTTGFEGASALPPRISDTRIVRKCTVQPAWTHLEWESSPCLFLSFSPEHDQVQRESPVGYVFQMQRRCPAWQAWVCGPARLGGGEIAATQTHTWLDQVVSRDFRERCEGGT